MPGRRIGDFGRGRTRAGTTYAQRVTDIASRPRRISRWGHAWRILAMLVISGLSAAAITAPTNGAIIPDDRLVWLRFVDPFLGLLALVVTMLRHRHPVVIAMLVTALSAVSLWAVGPSVLVLASLATRRRFREIIPVTVVAVAAGFVQEWLYPTGGFGTWWGYIAFAVPVTAIPVVLGYSIGQRRELVDNLRDRAETAEREQQARVAQARTAERARIAREMHDVLAHRMSLVAMHAGVLSYRRDLTAQEQATAARTIEENAHLALRDLRDILGVLRDPTAPADAGAIEPPQPSLTDIPELIEQTRTAGTTVDFDDAVDGPVPASVGRAAYRIVQEALTNARKHAPGARVDVALAGSAADGVRVSIHNVASINPAAEPLPGAGLGLLGLSERVDLAGGRIEHGVDPDGGYTVRAWLPCPS